MRKLKKLKVGKRIGSEVYVHCDFMRLAPEKVIAAYERALWNLEYARNTLPVGSYVPQDNEWNVVKFNMSPQNRFGKISLLLYDMFYIEPHPKLLQSIVVDLDGDSADIWVKRDYRYYNVTNILHRKEKLVDGRHIEGYEKWTKLTQQEEMAGLLSLPHARKIGRESYWVRLLSERGLTIYNYELMKIEKANSLQQELEERAAAEAELYNMEVDYGWERSAIERLP